MESFSRRAVLAATAGATALVAVGPVTAGAAPVGGSASAPLRSEYEHSVGRIFTASNGAHTIGMRLTSIRDVVPTSARQRAHCFILVLEPVDSVSAPDAIYVLRGRGVATHRLFLSAFGTDNAVQAIINRPA